VGRAFKPADEDAVLVRILKDLGVVVFAKTNLPQSIMVCSALCFPLNSIYTSDIGIQSLVKAFLEYEIAEEKHSGTRQIIRFGD